MTSVGFEDNRKETIHYYQIKRKMNEFPEEILQDVREVLQRYESVIQQGNPKGSAPLISPEVIGFRSLHDIDLEPFIIQSNDEQGCYKTNGEDYDVVICCVLLVLRHYLGTDFQLRSEGLNFTYKNQEIKVYITENWEKAYHEILDMGFNLDLEQVIIESFQ